MYLSSLRRLLFASTLFVLSWSSSALAAANVSVSPTGDSSYTVQGSNMDGVAGIQLDISYDAASLAGPTVTQGGVVTGAMLVSNTKLPGLIKIAIISSRAFSGSGQIAAISFASKTGSGGITSIATSMIDAKGASFAATASNLAGNTSTAPVTSQPSNQDSPSPQQQTGPAPTASSPVSATTATYPGTITMSAEQQQRADSQPAASPATPVYAGEPATAGSAEHTQPSGIPAAEAKPVETPQYVVYKGVLERFRQYNGSKKLSAMAALFDKKVAQTIRQEPAIMISDGHSKATLTIDIPARINSSPNFAVNGGKLVSFKKDQQIKGRWIVEVSPESGTVKATLSIIAGAEEFEFPLTVAPPVKTALTPDEAGWNRFLKEAGTSSAPLHDLNNDGVRDYQDEFIFVARYLSNKTAPSKPASKASKKK